MSNLEKFDEINEKIGFSQFLLFLVGGDLYAIKSLKAQEIVEYGHITKVPMMNSFVKGVTNIRGNMVPVIDLLERFNLGTTIVAPKTSIIVINHQGKNGMIHIGIIIDEVHEVDDIEKINLKDAPDFGSKIDKKFIEAMGKYNNEYIAILNTKTILDLKELSYVLEDNINK